MAGIPPAAVSFDESAPGYEQIMARALLPVAAEVVRRASLRPKQRVLDVGTGTGIALAAAAGDGRELTGLDGAPHMLELARKRLPAANFVHADFAAMPFPNGAFDVIVSSHALLFSLSVPGPEEVTPTTIFGPIYERYGIDTAGRYPEVEELASWATEAGWNDVETATDPTVAIHLVDEAEFRTWRNLGARAQATRAWPPERHEALTSDMLAMAPRQPDGSFRLPFGALYLSARVSPTV